MDRQTLITQLAEAMTLMKLPHPTRVAIDGVDASGKTTLADELVEPVRCHGRQVIRVSVDGFHRPKADRYKRGPSSAEGYYRDTTDYPAVRREVLEPLGPTGNRYYRTAVFDFRSEQTVNGEPLLADANAVLLFEGVFLLRPELADCWDFRIFIQADFSTTLNRAMSRDLYLFGTADITRERYLNRYIPGQRIYLDTVRPSEQADVTVLNDDPTNASLDLESRPLVVGALDDFIANPRPDEAGL